jgi:hypothetical protein
MSTALTAYQNSCGFFRYQPLAGSFVHEIPGAAIVPSAFLNGTSIPPRPERESESVSAAAMSDIVGFAQFDSMTVFGATGLPAGKL